MGFLFPEIPLRTTDDVQKSVQKRTQQGPDVLVPLSCAVFCTSLPVSRRPDYNLHQSELRMVSFGLFQYRELHLGQNLGWLLGLRGYHEWQQRKQINWEGGEEECKCQHY